MTKPNLTGETDKTAEEMRDLLLGQMRLGETTVVFTKMNGEERTLRGTLNMNDIPVDQHPNSGDGVEKQTKEKGDFLAVFDLDIKEWRSFKPSRVTQIKLT